MGGKWPRLAHAKAKLWAAGSFKCVVCKGPVLSKQRYYIYNIDNIVQYMYV